MTFSNMLPMNRFQTASLFALLVVLSWEKCPRALGGFPGESQVDRSIMVEGEKTLPLIDRGKVKMELVVPEGSSAVSRYAAGEAQKILARSLGQPIPIVAKPTLRGKAKVTSIVVGDCPLAKQNGVDVSSLSRDAYIIRRVGSMVFIAGRDDPKVNPAVAMTKSLWGQMYERGSLFGVYEFLERFVGVRFYFPGELGTVIPRHRDLSLEETIHIVDRPDYSTRKFSMNSGQWYEGGLQSNHQEAKTLNYVRLRMETRYVPNAHGLSRLGYLTRFGKTHPEYFAMMKNGKRHNDPAIPHPGQLCLNSGVREQIFQDAKAYLTGVSAKEAGIQTERFGYVWDQSAAQPGFFNIMPQDAFYPCRCEKCLPHTSQGQKAISLHVWEMVNETAKRLKDEGVPGHLTMMAYAQYRAFPPEHLEDNVLVMTAVRGPWADAYPVMGKTERDIVKQWQALGHRKTWLWNYANKYGPMDLAGVPALTPKAIGKYYQKMSDHILGAYMQSGTDHYLFNYLNYYVFSKVSWDNQTDLDALLDEHYQLMFGNARHPMETFFGELEDLWLTQTYGKPIDTPLGPTASAPSTYRLWSEIYSPPRLHHFDQLLKQAETLARDDKRSLARVRLMRKAILGPLISAAKEYHQTTQPDKNRIFQSTKLGNPNAIKLDGKLNEAAWETSRSLRLTPSGKSQPQDDSPIDTVVRMMHDDDHLYVSFDCKEPWVDHVNAAKHARDAPAIRRESSIGIFMSPDGNPDHYHEWVVNAAGAVADRQASQKGEATNFDTAWNSRMKAGVSRTNGRQTNGRQTNGQWSAELAIPRQDLPTLDLKRCRIYFYRFRSLVKTQKRKAGNAPRLFGWGPALKRGFHDVEHFGRLSFDDTESTSVVKNSTFFVASQGRRAGAWVFSDKKQLAEGQDWELGSDHFLRDGRSLKLVNGAKGKRMLATQMLPELKPNTPYRVAFHIRTQNVVPLGKGGGACVNIYGDKNLFLPRNGYQGDMPWTRQSFTFTTGPKTNRGVKSYMRLCLNNASGTVWFDDVSIIEVKTIR